RPTGPPDACGENCPWSFRKAGRRRNGEIGRRRSFVCGRTSQGRRIAEPAV
ncbi:hypothetical protein L916_08916, partial [Phytophthora nicotianae]